MKQEARSLVAVALSIGVFVVWYSYFSPKKPPQKVEENKVVQVANPEKADAASDKISQTGTAGSVINDPQKGIPEENIVVDTDLYRVELTNNGGVPISWNLKKYQAAHGEDKTINLVTEGSLPLSEEQTVAGLPERPRYRVVEKTDNKVIFSWKNPEVELLKIYEFDPKSYKADVTIAVRNIGQNTIESTPALMWEMMVPKPKKKGFFGFLKGPENEFKPVYLFDGKVGKDQIEKEGNLLWGGIEDRYFISAIIPRESGNLGKIFVRSKTEETQTQMTTGVVTPKQTVLSQGEVRQKFTVYVGPRERQTLMLVGGSLEKAIDYGWFSFIAIPILYLLKFFYGVIKNYGVAIIILTIFVKLLLNPLTKYSMKSMKAMQKLQPKMKELKEKYKNDKERLNTETMQLFRANKVNPMSGCLPMLLQLPIYIALYKVLWNAIELYKAPFIFFYKDLSAPDPYLVMPIALGVFMWLQQKMTPSASADPAQAKMMQIMPIMFTAFMLFLPSGLVLYILINTVMSVVQQWMMNNDIRFRDLIRGKIKVAA